MGIILKSSFWVTLRNILIVLIRAIYMLVIFKIIEPDEFGSYSAYLGFISFAVVFAQMGLSVFIIQRSNIDEDIVKSCTTFGLIASCIVFIIAFVIALNINFTDIVLLIIGLIFIPFRVLGLIPIGILEKNFKFKETAGIDLITQIVMCFSTIILLYAGLGKYALMIGFVLMTILSTILLFRKAKIPFSINTNKENLRDIFKFGFVYSFTNIAGQAKNLIPIIMSSSLPLQQVGIAMFSNKLSENINILKETVGRIATSAFCSMDKSKVKENLNRYSLLVGLSVFMLNYIGIKMIIIIVPLFLGTKWNDSFCLLPFLAIGSIFSTISLIHASLFIAKNKVKFSSLFFVLQNALLVLGIYLCIKQFGMLGYGYGSLSLCISFLISCYLIKILLGNFLSLELILFLILSSTIFLISNIYIELTLIMLFCLMPTIRINTLQILYKLLKRKIA